MSLQSIASFEGRTTSKSCISPVEKQKLLMRFDVLDILRLKAEDEISHDRSLYPYVVVILSTSRVELRRYTRVVKLRPKEGGIHLRYFLTDDHHLSTTQTI